MGIMEVLHMNKGDGETSYAKNSEVQGKIISISRPVLEEALMEVLCTNVLPCMGIADLGCSCGPNTLSVVTEIMDIVHAKCRDLGQPTPEFTIFLNDLPFNDFNNIFRSLPAFYNQLKSEKKDSSLGPCFISATPGSFYGRLFPLRSIHFVHSSSSLHWLSKVPGGLDSNATKSMNKGKLYIAKSSPRRVLEAYAEQFHEDFSTFLRSRAEEIVPGGRMVLSFIGRRSADPTDESCDQWDILAQALISMVSEGLIEREKVDSFNAPFYAPCMEELKVETAEEGSFTIDRLEGFELDWDGGMEGTVLSRGEKVARTVRAVVESMLESHFGIGQELMDDLFKRYGGMVGDYLSKNRSKLIDFVISFVRKDY